MSVVVQNHRSAETSSTVTAAPWERYVCRRAHCVRRRKELIHETLGERRQRVTKAYALAFHCRVCMGAMHGRFRCSNTECQHYYERMQADLDIEDLDQAFGKLFGGTQATQCPLWGAQRYYRMPRRV